MDWRFVVAPLGLAIGFGLGWRTIKRSRQPADCSGALLQWTERPVSAWRENWAGALFITLHGASILVVATLFLLDPTWSAGAHKLFLIDATPFMPSEVRAGFQQDLFGVVIFGLGLVAVFCGSLLAFPFATRLIRPISVCILPDGLVRGPYLWSWSSFSYFSTEPGSYLIWFYPHRTREMACMAWQPASEEVYGQAVTLLSENLPQAPPQEAVSWVHRRIAFLGLGLAIVAPYLACGLLLYLRATPWGWMYYTFVTFAVYVLGMVLLRVYQR